jgi:threonine dehydratase
MVGMNQIDVNNIREAAARIKPYAHRTAVLTSRYFDDRLGAEVFFKCENFQKGGAFKFRGAANALMSLSDDEASRGVVTHSSGNHAQAVALAARLRGIDATIVMHNNAPAVKQQAVEDYGARIVPVEPVEQARVAATNEIAQRSGAVIIHPYNDPRIIAGQGTAALELIEDAGPFDMMLAPVGGGGLLSGTSIATSALCPAAETFGTEPMGADDAWRSFHDGRIHPSDHPNTIADGLLTSLGDLTFAVIRRHVRDIVTVSEDSIVDAMRTVWMRMKIIIEPSAAVPVAAMLSGKLEVTGKRVGVILSGGNVDLDRLPWVV